MQRGPPELALSTQSRTMIIRTLLLLIAATATASALSEENINQQLDAAPGGRIIVDVDFGTIDVSAGADDKVSSPRTARSIRTTKRKKRNTWPRPRLPSRKTETR